jgi:hypothetical protein
VADGSIAYGSPTFTGRIGSLGVDASGSGFSFSSPDDEAPLLSTDVSPSSRTGAVEDPGGVDGAALLRDVLNDLGGSVSATYDMAAAADLDVVPSAPLQGMLPADGDGTNTVSVDWPEVDPGTAPVVTTGGDYDTYLKLFDVTPTREGVHTGEAGLQLVDEDRSFSTDFGFAAGTGDAAIVPGTLYNVTTGASCSSFRIVDGATLECANADLSLGLSGLSGGHRGEREGVNEDGAFVPDATWAPGDRWEVRGDLDAMRTVVVETLLKLATQIEASEDPATTGRCR